MSFLSLERKVKRIHTLLTTQDGMQVYVTIIDELRYKDKFRYMNKTTEGVHASIQRHLAFFSFGEAMVDHECISQNLSKLRDNYTNGLLFTLNSGTREFEIRCHYDYLLE
jgi:hypothetical protein